MKKSIAVLLFLALVFSLFSAGCAEDTDDSYMWSEPGLKYIAAEFPAQKEIPDEKEAEAYADSLWSLLTDAPLPEGIRDMVFDRHDKSYHYSISNQDGFALYNVGFLSNGVIQHISYRVSDPRRFADDARKDPAGLEPAVWEDAKARIDEWMEKVSPGILALVEPLKVYSVVDVGDRLYLFISAMPLDPSHAGYVSLIAMYDADGHVGIMDYSLYGAG